MKNDLNKGWVKFLIFGFAAIVLFALTMGVFAGAETGGKYKYIGAKKCGMCHKGEKKGSQFEKWQGSKHSQAFKTLQSEEAKKVAGGMGITDPSTSEKCLPCHVTGFGVPDDMFVGGRVNDDGVTCEACHGPGSEYQKMNVMKDHAQSVANGLVEVKEGVCVKCHKQEGNPNFKSFNFQEALKLVAHPAPKAAQ